MSTALAHVRLHVETALGQRAPNAFDLQPKLVYERISSGIEVVDGLLEGGLPVGAIAEMTGVTGSGRTTMALAFTSALVQQGKVAAWVDAADALDPAGAALQGVDLARLLWVRCGARADASPERASTTREAAVSGFSGASPTRSTQGGGSPHPRSEGRDMPAAISAIMQAHGGLHDHQLRREMKSVGTPGAPNRPLTAAAPQREEQVPFDRLPARRGEQLATLAFAPRCAEPQPHRRKTQGQYKSNAQGGNRGWPVLDQAIRSTDLLLQSGGFGLIVLDLGSTPAEMAWRIPLATWFRFRAACERTRTSLLLLTQHPCARSSAELVVRLETGRMEAQGNVLTGIRWRAELERQRFKSSATNIIPIRKPPQAERTGRWQGRAAWAV